MSKPTSISIVVLPLFFSPLIITQFNGAAPLYIGNNEACKFIHPYLGISNTSLVNIWPNATTIIKSGFNSFKYSTASLSSFNFSG